MKKRVLRWVFALAVLLPCLLLSAAATGEQTVTAAMIGEASYETLDAALADAQDGDTVVLLDNYTYQGVFYFNTGKNVTLDLGGHRLLHNIVSNGLGGLNVQSGTLTVKNGEVRVASVYGTGVGVSGGKLIVAEDASITGGTEGIYLSGSAQLEVYGNVSAIGAVYGDEAAIQANGTVCAVRIYDGAVVSGTKFALYADTADVVISGGDFTGEMSLTEGASVSGGTFDVDVSDWVAKGAVCTQSGERYVVSKETYTISVGEVTNGTVTVDKTTGTSGETVTVTATPAQGYKLTATLVDGVAIEGNTFTISGDHVVTAAFEAERKVTASGYCGGEGDGTNLTWTWYSDGELVISGSGAMQDYSYGQYTPWARFSSDYTHLIYEVTIGQGVTTIGDYAFMGCTGVCSVSIADSVTSIGDAAFYENCLFPGGLIIPDSVTSIGEDAFAHTSQLYNITIGSGVTSVGSGAFADTALSWINYTGDLAGWCAISFEDAEAHPFGGNYSGGGTFCVNGKPLTEIVIPDGVTKINDYAFLGCQGPMDVTIPESVDSIGEAAFYNSFWDNGSGNPSSLKFLGNVPTNIGANAFATACDDLTIYYQEGTSGWLESEYYDTETGTWCDHPLVMVADPTKIYSIILMVVGGGTVTVDKTTGTSGETVTVTATPAQGYKLTAILVDGVAIEGNTFTISGDHVVTAAFEAGRKVTASGTCGGEGDGTNLTWTLYEDGELVISGDGEMAYYTYSSAVPWNDYRSSITKLTINDGVTSVGCSYGKYTFCDCTNLTSVSIGADVSRIFGTGFETCVSLTAITVDKRNSSFSSKDGVLFNANQTTLIQYPAGKTDTTYTIPDSVKQLEGSVFENCSNLTSVTIPDGVLTIPSGLFQNCTSLVSVNIPYRVVYINNYAFYNCTSLSSVTIPDGVRIIGSNAFGRCRSLTSVTIPSSVNTIEEKTFDGCTSLTSVTIPDSVTTIGNYAFHACSSLTSVTIPDSVTTIKYGAFRDCTGLTRMEFLGSAPASVDSPVEGCSNLTIYCHEGAAGWPTTGTWQGRPLVMIPAENEGDEEQEDTYFEVDEYKSTGTAPVQTDKVFAGWYTDNTFGQAHTAATGSAYAKFVNKDVFRVKAQITANTTADSEFADIRFVTTVDNLNYKKVGFKITFGGKTVTKETSTVYSSIVSKSGGVAFNYEPSVFHEDSKYFMTYVLTDIPNANFDDTFTVTPYWVTLDGTVVEGVTNELSVSMGY